MSKARFEIPGYGTLIGIDELSQLTGISKHTIRSWRKPENTHLAKFLYYRNPVNQNLYYRLDEVEDWLKAQGMDGVDSKAAWTVQEGAVNAHTLPLQKAMDYKERELRLRLQAITTENAQVTFKNLDPNDRGGSKCFRQSEEGIRIANEQWRVLHPEDPETFVNVSVGDRVVNKNLLPMRRFWESNPAFIAELPRWYFVLVNSQRIRIANLTPGILTPEEICAIPIGNVPPVNENLK